MSKEIKPYSYFDKPDGEDTFDKLLHVLKPTALIALGMSTYDVLVISHPKGYIQTLGRYAYVGLPIMGVATAFVCTTNLAASARKKDDKLNWFLGGFAAGSVFGVWSRKPIVGFNMGMFLGILAVMKKTCVDNGWIVNPGNNIAISNGGVWINKMDWTLTDHRPGKWTSG